MPPGESCHRKALLLVVPIELMVSVAAVPDWWMLVCFVAKLLMSKPEVAIPLPVRLSVVPLPRVKLDDTKFRSVKLKVSVPAA